MKSTTKIVISVISIAVASLIIISFIKLHALSETQSNMDAYQKNKIHVKYLKLYDKIALHIISGAVPDFNQYTVNVIIDKDTLIIKKGEQLTRGIVSYSIDLPDLEEMYISGGAQIDAFTYQFKKLTIYSSGKSFIRVSGDSVNAICNGNSYAFINSSMAFIELHDSCTVSLKGGSVTGSVSGKSMLQLLFPVVNNGVKVFNEAKVVRNLSHF